MRVGIELAVICLSSLLLVSAKNTPGATVYVLGPTSEQPLTNIPRTAKSSSASAIFAHQLGISKYYDAQALDESELQLVDALRGHQSPIFKDYEPEAERRVLERPNALIIVEDVDRLDVISTTLQSQPSFFIVDTPDARSNSILLKQYAADLERSLDGAVASEAARRRCDDMTALLPSQTSDPQYLDQDRGVQYTWFMSCKERGALLTIHVTGLKSVAAESGLDSTSYKNELRSITELAETIAASSAKLILMTTISGQPKSPIPGQISEHQLRHMNALRARQHQPELPISGAVPVDSTTFSSKETTPTNATIPKGVIIPACFKEKSAAIKGTKNCTGHGSVYLKYIAKNSNDEKPSECWTCKCHSTFRVSSDGRVKTTYWAGPACQKKDVSVPFFLIAGFVILLAATISWGIGLLFSIGEAELPSVIGAGVSGPRAQR